jgi:hypothetical protein
MFDRREPAPKNEQAEPSRREAIALALSALTLPLFGCGGGERIKPQPIFDKTTLHGDVMYRVQATDKGMEYVFRPLKEGSYLAQIMTMHRGSLQLSDSRLLSPGEPFCMPQRGIHVQLVRADKGDIDVLNSSTMLQPGDEKEFVKRVDEFRRGTPCLLQIFSSDGLIIERIDAAYGIAGAKRDEMRVRTSHRPAFGQIFGLAPSSSEIRCDRIDITHPWNRPVSGF